MNTESKVCCFSSGTATWMKKETSNSLKVIVNFAIHWRLPVAVSSYAVKRNNINNNKKPNMKNKQTMDLGRNASMNKECKKAKVNTKLSLKTEFILTNVKANKNITQIPPALLFFS